MSEDTKWWYMAQDWSCIKCRHGVTDIEMDDDLSLACPNCARLARLATLEADLTNANAMIEELGKLQAEREKSLTGWYWACSDYLDEGWCGQFDTRELAEAHAKEAMGEDWSEDAVSFTKLGHVLKLEADHNLALHRLRSMTWTPDEKDARIAELEAENAQRAEEIERLNALIEEEGSARDRLGSKLGEEESDG